MRHPLPFAPRRGRVQAKRSTQGMHENHRNNLSLNNDSLSRSAGAVRNHRHSGESRNPWGDARAVQG